MATFKHQDGDRPLDGFTIQYGIGRGGFGDVYYAVSDAGRQVALKEIQNYEDIELRGISHCMNLKSQHLVSIFDVKKDAGGTPWVIMEFVSGQSLRQILDQAPEGLGPEKAAYFIRELAKGLTYLHGAGVVHRDLKPHNIFFEDGVVKIGDYSLSKVITTSHRSGHTMTVGSVHYMAPEISMGSYDKTVDIYALGVILYELLKGEPPYIGQSMGEVLMKHLSSTPDVSDIPEPFASTILKAMAREPADRFQSAEEMATALFGAEPISDMTGAFGPASLSIVSQQAAKHAVGPEFTSTDRIQDALAATLPARQASLDDSSMYLLGRGFRRLGMVTGIIPHDRIMQRDDYRDKLPAIVRYPLMWGTLAIFMLGLAVINNILVQPFMTIEDAIPTPWSPAFMQTILFCLVCILSTLASRALLNGNLFGESGIGARVLQLTIAGMLTIPCFTLMFRGDRSMFPEAIIFPIGATMIIQNWPGLIAPNRVSRMRLGPILFAGTITFLETILLGNPAQLTSAGIACGSLLCLQVGAPYLNTKKPVAGPTQPSNKAADELQSALQQETPQPKVSVR